MSRVVLTAGDELRTVENPGGGVTRHWYPAPGAVSVTLPREGGRGPEVVVGYAVRWA